MSPLSAPPITLPIAGPAPIHSNPELVRQRCQIGSATARAFLHKLGIRQTFFEGPTARLPGAKVVGPAVCLQFMPQGEDNVSGRVQEHVERSSALWHVFDGAVVVPRLVAPLILQATMDHEDWETFSRQRLAEGGSLWTYCPLSDDGRREYEAWRRGKAQ
jgi:hypothetical protein